MSECGGTEFWVIGVLNLLEESGCVGKKAAQVLLDGGMALEG